MNNKPLHPVFRLMASGALSILVLYLYLAVRPGPPRLIILGGVAATAFMLLIPVMVRGDSSQKMLASILLFLPSFGLVMAIIGVLSYL